MSFWIRNIIFGSVLIALALLLIDNQALLFTAIEKENTKSEDVVAIDPADKAKIKKSPSTIIKKSSNAAADGLSRFYANLHGDDNSKGPRIRNNIVYLPDPKGDIVKLLEARRMVTRPLRKNWRGSNENYPFRLGETLFQKLSEYANSEGLEVIWWLNRDFIVKDPFRINKDIIKTAYQVGKAVEGHFAEGINVYFCNQQRALVLIDLPIPYLDEECILLPVKKRRR
ncbi:MAG: TcpQ domain-containing protein [Colwellia sp.]|nr:TcpQ domain-containing protein [Colwellia sp.]